MVGEYFQQVRGDGALDAGLRLVPLGLGMAVALFFTGRIIDRTGADRPIILAGLALAAAGTVPFALAGPHTGQVLLGCALLVTGLGLGAVPLAAMTTTYRGLTPEQMAPATSAGRIAQQVGGSFGTVVLAVVLQSQGGTGPGRRRSATRSPGRSP